MHEFTWKIIAQVLVKHPHEKYSSANYEMIGRILYGYFGDGITDVQQLARRLLANIRLANAMVMHT